MAAPTASVILPTHDRPSMLEDAVESVLSQTIDDFELIVVDDGSAEPVEPRLRSDFVDDRIRVLRHDTNKGANAARNAGIAAASGEILTFLDDDDRWLPDKLARQLAAFEEGPDALGVVIVGQRYVDAAGRTTNHKRPAINGPATRALLTGCTAGPFSTLAVHRRAIRSAGTLDERFPSLQDREWLIRLSKHATFRSIPEPLVIRRMGDYDQIGDHFAERRDQTHELMRETHGPTADAYGIREPFEATLDRGLAASALRAGAYADARRYAFRACRRDPSWASLVYLVASFGGGLTYRPAKRLRHRLGQLAYR